MLSQIKVLSEGEIQQVHDASLEILETVGMRFPNRRVLSLLESGGARVDYDAQVAKFPRKFVEQHLQAAAKTSSHLLRRENGLSVNEGDFQVDMCGQVTIYDYDKKDRRYGTTEDLVKGIVLGNELKNVRKVNAMITPSDVPADHADVYMAKALFTYSKKKTRPWIYRVQSAEAIIEIARIAYGQKRFKEEKPVFYTVESISPLGFSDHSLEIALVMVNSGMNIGLGPIPMAGATAPVTPAGVLTLANAEAIGGIILVQTLNPGQPVYYHGGAHTMDLKSMVCSFGLPNQTLLGVAHLQMAGKYGLPCIANVGGTDSLAYDTQSGVQKGIGAALSLAGGVRIIIDVGLIGADQCTSFEQLVIDNEWVDYLNHIFRGFQVNDETIALDLIKKVGIGGNFVMEDHTLDHMRDSYWDSSLFTSDTWETWMAKGKDDVFERAHEKVVSIFAEHYPPKPVIDSDKVARIDELVRDVVGDAAGSG